MPRDKPGRGRHHPLHDTAVLGIALALLLDSLIGPVASLLLFFRAVAAHAWSGGRRPGLLAATLVALIANHFRDIELPDGSGLELMQELRKTRDTPGIAMSGFGSEEDVRASRSAGFAEHLTKPINYRTLEEAIQRVGARCEGAAAAR
jgi:CheY-like chemotaxis protein